MARSKNGNSSSAPLSDQPWWVRSLVWVGAPTAASAYLLYFVLGQITDGQKQMLATMQAHQTDMASLVRHLEQDSEQQWVLIGISQRTCINTSKTDADRLACVSVVRKTP